MAALGVGDAVGRLLTAPTATIRTTATLRDAARALAADGLGLLVVVDPDAVRGVISERDLVTAAADGADLDEERVRDHTTEEVVSVDEATSVLGAAGVMADAEVRHLAVTRRGTLVGVVSIRDLMAVLVAGVEATMPVRRPA